METSPPLPLLYVPFVTPSFLNPTDQRLVKLLLDFKKTLTDKTIKP